MIAQEAYLCTGTHEFTAEDWPLVTREIFIGAQAFIGARAFVLPGIKVGRDAIIGACSVVTRDVPPGTICAGNPCAVRRNRSDLATRSEDSRAERIEADQNSVLTSL